MIKEELEWRKRLAGGSGWIKAEDLERGFDYVAAQNFSFWSLWVDLISSLCISNCSSNNGNNGNKICEGELIVMVVSATFPNDSYDYFYIRLGKVDAVYFNNTLAYVKFRE